jgi:hypothetical protein
MKSCTDGTKIVTVLVGTVAIVPLVYGKSRKNKKIRSIRESSLLF